MAFDLQDDFLDIFLKSGFQEDVIYTPSAGTAKTIRAIVIRNGGKTVKPGSNQADQRRFDIEIYISNKADNGVSSITENTDLVSLYREIGDAAKSDFVVRGIITNDAGAWHLGLA